MHVFKANIRCIIAAITAEMLERVAENVTRLMVFLEKSRCVLTLYTYVENKGRVFGFNLKLVCRL